MDSRARGKVESGNVVVIRYEGPKGGPGCRELIMVASTISRLGLVESTAVITDSRFSGMNKGACIGHVSPEAMDGGPLALVKDDDLIEINIPERKLNILISNEKLTERLAKWQPPKPRAEKGILVLYAKLGESLSKGGGFRI